MTAPQQPAARYPLPAGRAGTVIRSATLRPTAPEAMRRDVADVLRRRAEHSAAPVTLVVRDASAITIACLFRSDSRTGQVFDRLARHGEADVAELIEAAEFERSFADLTDAGALRCLITWARAKAVLQRRRSAGQL